MSEERIPSFEKFWPFYVREHSKKITRVMHFAGTTLAVGVLATAIVKKKPAIIPLALVAGYGPAWISHFFIEHNKPATFKYPLWSLISDFKMFGKMIDGTMDAEVERCIAEAAEQQAQNGVTNGTSAEAGATKDYAQVN